ncbi:guanine nucleotide-binding protein subunit alpha [Xylographa soralifera]|nr:guanine nucleotide-binding protein subunit alpha [Xylographa soralifera]
MGCVRGEQPMDSLSVSASIIGLQAAVGSVATFLARLVNNTSFAPELARHVLTEIYDVSSCLGGLKPFLLGTKTASTSRTSMIMLDQLIVTLTECVTTFSDLEKALESLKSTQPNTVMERVRWAMNDQTFRRILSRLQNSKISLNLILTMLSCVRTEEARDCAKELHNIVQQALSSNHDLLNRVRSLEPRHGLVSKYGSMKSRNQQYILDDNVTAKSHTYEKASRLPITLTMSSSYTFKEDLHRSPVYSRANEKNFTLSLPSSATRTTGWSVFSGISLSEVSNLAVFALPISAYEFYNNQAYTLQRPIVEGKAGNSKYSDSKITHRFKVLILGKTRAEPSSSCKVFVSKRAVGVNSHWQQTNDSFQTGHTKSGKSTLFKQFQHLSGEPFNLLDRKNAVESIHAVLKDSISDMHECLTGLANQGISFGDDRSRAFQIRVLEFKYRLAYSHSDFLQVIEAVKELWKDWLVQNFMYRQIGLQHNNIAHYLNNAERYTGESFLLSDQDILGLWTQSTGVYSQPVMIEGVLYNVNDVGGARSERKKWIHSFEAVDCVVFTVGLSDYNVDWFNDVNSLEESLELFKSIITSKWFTKSTFFLIFTNIDLFKKKLMHDPMEGYFPDYTGGSDFSNALEYWIRRFRDIKPHPDSQLHIQLAESTASFKDSIMELHDLMSGRLSTARSPHRRPLSGSTLEAWVEEIERKSGVEKPQSPPSGTGCNVVQKCMRGMAIRPKQYMEAICRAL